MGWIFIGMGDENCASVRLSGFVQTGGTHRADDGKPSASYS